MQGARFNKSNLMNSKFLNSRILGCCISKCNITNVDFNEAILTATDFSGSFLEPSNEEIEDCKINGGIIDFPFTDQQIKKVSCIYNGLSGIYIKLPGGTEYFKRQNN